MVHLSILSAVLVFRFINIPPSFLSFFNFPLPPNSFINAGMIFHQNLEKKSPKSWKGRKNEKKSFWKKAQTKTWGQRWAPLNPLIIDQRENQQQRRKRKDYYFSGKKRTSFFKTDSPALFNCDFPTFLSGAGSSGRISYRVISRHIASYFLIVSHTCHWYDR